MIGFPALARACLPVLGQLVQEWLPGGRREGHEWKALNPTRADGRLGSFSINLNTGQWADFATGDKGGDAISLYAYLHGCGQAEAARELAQKLRLNGETSSSPATSPAPAKPRSDWRPVLPVPELAGPPPAAHVARGKPQATWAYRDRAGALLGFVCRFRTSDGGKEVLPLTWCVHPDGRGQWRWMAFPAPRPLYLPGPWSIEKPVLVVEGEKCADAAHQVLGGRHLVLTWPGGARAIEKVDWSPLQGREVVIWPDADAQVDRRGQRLPLEAQPGTKAALRIAEILRAAGCAARVLALPPPGELADGWDVADAIAEGWGEERLEAWIEERAQAPVSARRATGQPAQPAGAAELLHDSKGRLLAVEANVTAILLGEPQYSSWHFDTFHNRLRAELADGTRRDIDDDDIGEVQQWLQRNAIPTVKFDVVRRGLRHFARTRQRDELLEHIEALPGWDGVPRIETALETYWNASLSSAAPDAPESEKAQDLTRYASRNLFLSAIARATRPGCKVDTCLVLEGPQGAGKSLSVQILGGSFFTEISAHIGHLDFRRELRNAWFVELSELASLRRGEVETMKSILSDPSDRFVEKFEILPRTYPRRCVFVGTTNESRYLIDPTGNRRFVPVTVGAVDLERLRADRDQLFAEARAKLTKGATWWEYPKEGHQAAVELRRRVDPWEGELEPFLRGRTVTTVGACLEALDVEVARRTPMDEQRVAILLRHMGWTARRKRQDGEPKRLWEAPQPPPPPPGSPDEPF